jgi:hypothetical protein
VIENSNRQIYVSAVIEPPGKSFYTIKAQKAEVDNHDFTGNHRSDRFFDT